jgi:phosphatidylglycerol lysyltransferase
LFAAAIWAIHRELGTAHLADVGKALRDLPASAVLLSLLAAAAGYVVLALYDTLALAYLERPLPVGRSMLAGFVGYAFSHSMGLPLLTGGAVRYRLYTAWGLSGTEIAGVVAFNSITLWLGLGAMAVLGGLLAPAELAAIMGIGPGTIVAFAILVLVLLLAYPALPLVLRGPLTLGRWSFSLPRPAIAATQIGMAGVDWALAALCLWVLLPPEAGVGFLAFACLFSAASVIGIISHVPGGVGVFEAVLILALPGSGLDPRVAAALVVYRLCYYVTPLVAAAVLFVGHQLREIGDVARERIGVVRGWAHVVVPNLLFILVFVAGLVLLVSGATPSAAERLAWLAPIAPLALIELSHFLGSLAGLALILLALGLRRRLDAAWLTTSLVLAAGIVFSLLKGFDWEEALYLAVVLAVLLPSRSAFYRRSALLDQNLGPSWLAAVLAVVLATLWLGFFSFRHVDYAHDLWWQFLAEAEAPRFLRATAGLIIATAALSITQLMRYARPRDETAEPGPALLEAQAAILAAENPLCSAWLALLGDKRFLFSPSGRSFIMYGVRGRCWVALGPPVGQRSERLELLWRFRELCDEWGGRTVFYEVPPAMMPELVELGLTFYKIGEQAYVDLRGFGLEGNARRGLRYTLRKARKEGSSFEVIPVEGVPAILPLLRTISDEWLGTRSAKEKGFSLGRFEPDYLLRFPVAVIRRSQRIVAFANIWEAPDRSELSLDLMRYGSEAPRDVMEHLFIELMLWGKEQGYGRFDLGMAPLSGLDGRKLAPFWSRAGALIFRLGEDFYNFEGLRRFKEKFRPDWEPRYLAAPGGPALPAVLTDVTFLIGGGIAGVLRQPATRPLPLGTQPA